MTPPCVVPTFRPYTSENLEFGGFYASSCESRVNAAGFHMWSHVLFWRINVAKPRVERDFGGINARRYGSVITDESPRR